MLYRPHLIFLLVHTGARAVKTMNKRERILEYLVKGPLHRSFRVWREFVMSTGVLPNAENAGKR